MNIADWKHMATRLESLDDKDCREALYVVRQVLENPARYDGAKPEIAVCHFLWGCFTRALDHGDFSEADEARLSALNAEMAGHTFCARVSLGWLVKSPSAPADEPSLADFGLNVPAVA